jgi:TrpR-related protein YerC/YecD
MTNDKTSVWKTPATRQLAEVLAAIDSTTDMQNFLRDVMTEKEIIEISSRLEAARMLQAGSTYADIVAKTRLSSRTVARISDWMQNGCKGYGTVIEQINQHTHMSSARAA